MAAAVVVVVYLVLLGIVIVGFVRLVRHRMARSRVRVAADVAAPAVEEAQRALAAVRERFPTPAPRPTTVPGLRAPTGDRLPMDGEDYPTPRRPARR